MLSLTKIGYTVSRSIGGRKRLGLGVVALFAFLLAMLPQSASAALVAYDGTNITWDAATIVTGLVAAVVAGVAGLVVIFIIKTGINFVFGLFRKR